MNNSRKLGIIKYMCTILSISLSLCIHYDCEITQRPRETNGVLSQVCFAITFSVTIYNFIRSVSLCSWK